MDTTTTQPTGSYTVKKGDTLNGVAKSLGYNDYTEAGFSLPKSGSYDLIQPGEILSHSAPVGENRVAVTSGPARTATATATSQLSSMMAGLGNGATTSTSGTGEAEISDPYTQSLDKLSANSDNATKALIASIQAQRMNQKNSVNSQYDNYKRGLELLGIQHNEAQSTPELLMGHIQEAENQHQAKLQDIDVEINKALMDAEEAKTNKQSGILKEKMQYIKELKKERNDSIREQYDRMKAETGIGELKAHEIYAELSKLKGSEKEQYLQAVAQAYNIPLATLVQSVADEAVARQKGTKKTTSTTNKTTMGQALADAKAAIAAGADANATRQLFLENYPTSSAAYNAYFKTATSNDSGDWQP